MSVFVNGMYVGCEIYPGVYAEELAGPSWILRKENAQGWPCRVGEVKRAGKLAASIWRVRVLAMSGGEPIHCAPLHNSC